MPAMIDALIAKLEAAPCGSRELDAEIALAIGWVPIPSPALNIWASMWKAPCGQEYYSLPSWSTSLDAITALIAEKLPGCEYSSEANSTWSQASIHSPTTNDFHGWGSSEALARCIAFLKAWKEIGNENV